MACEFLVDGEVPIRGSVTGNNGYGLVGVAIVPRSVSDSVVEYASIYLKFGVFDFALWVDCIFASALAGFLGVDCVMSTIVTA